MRGGATLFGLEHNQSPEQIRANKIARLESRVEELEQLLKSTSSRERATSARLHLLEVKYRAQINEQDFDRLKSAMQRQYDILAAQVLKLSPEK